MSEVGTRLPLHCTSQGKVFLAAMSAAEARRVLSRRALEAYTPNTLVTWEQLAQTLDGVRQQEYAALGYRK